MRANGEQLSQITSLIEAGIIRPVMVKDHRTNVEVGNADGVLDGDLDPFIEAYLMQADEPVNG